VSDFDRLLAIRRLMANYRAPATGVLPSATAQDRRPQAYREGMGKPTALAEGLSAFMGQQPRYSVMDPQSDEFRRAREIGEQASVAAEFYGALSPFAAASTMASAQRAGNLLSPLTVFHGSPHRFKKFDASKIGTGEGAQAYGHGLYFAESPAVARQYQESLSDFDMLVDGKPFNPENPAHRAALEVKQRGGDVAIKDIVANYNQQIKDLRSRNARWADELAKSKEEELPFIKSGKMPVYSESTKGSFYTVDLPDEQVAKMLDWDKPIKDQPEVLNIIRSQINDADIARSFDVNVEKGISGANAMKNYVQGKTQADQSAVLQKLGVPGIRYLDAGSRGKGGTSNFVVFPGEESKLRIMEVNGKPVVIDEDEFSQGLLGL
jgi:hypothetical protein